MLLKDRLQRIAFARILSDLIEADSIIEEDEMSFLEDLNERFRISREMLAEAKKKNFAWALNTLKYLSDEQKSEIRQVLKDLSMSDGTCVPNEALQIMAALFVLEDKGEVFSIPSDSSHIDNLKVIYIENQDGTAESSYIYENLDAICRAFNQAGFDFVYIPKIAEEYKSMGEDYLRKVITYMIPSISSAMASSILNNLCTITTSRFCREILYAKVGVNVIGCKPSLLFKTGESYVVDAYNQEESERQPFSNFLRIELERDILSQITTFLDNYKRIVTRDCIAEIHPVSNKFKYSGFHRSLFDLIAFCRERVDYKMFINLADRKQPTIVFKAIEDAADSEEVKLTPLATALYLLMIQQSVFGNGLDWREYPGKEDKDRLLSMFNRIYARVGNRDDSEDYKDRILVSRIKKELRKLQGTVSNLNLFIPELRNVNGNSVYYVPVPPELVYVMDNGKETQMTDSESWRSL